MKLQSSIQLPPPPPFVLDLNIIPFDPVGSFGNGWRFEDEGITINGLGDGITGFVETLAKAVSMLPDKKEEALKLLFLTELSEGQPYITGEDRLKASTNRFLADPDLGWSLYQEKGQKTLRFLHDTFGVTWIEFLRRTLCYPDGSCCALFLCHKLDDSWGRNYSWLDAPRCDMCPALGLIE